MVSPASLFPILLALAPQDSDALHRFSVLVEDPHSGELVEAAEVVSMVGAEPTTHTVVLPETHESELVRRLVPRAGRVEVFLWSGADPTNFVAGNEAGNLQPHDVGVALRYIDHPADELVVLRDGSPVVVDELQLPQVVSAHPDAVPSLVRLDGIRYRFRTEFDEAVMGVPLDEGNGPAVLFLRGWTPPEERGVGCWQVLDPGPPSDSTPVDQVLVGRAQAPDAVHTVSLDDSTLFEFDPSTRLARGAPSSKSDSPPIGERVTRFAAELPDAPAEGLVRTWLLDLEVRAAAAGPSFADITAGREDDAELRFVSAAESAGVKATHFEGPRMQLDIRPTMGPGAAWGDVDGDGLVDLYLVQGGGRGGPAVPRNRLFTNDGDGTFTDVTTRSNTGDQGAGMGALFCDLDSDGDLDLYVANYGSDVLYWNDGEGVFTRAADGVLPDLDLWSAGVAASDYDKDGDLDLYVTSYLDYDESKMPPMDELERYQREDPVAMLPFAFPGQRNVFLRNDVTEDGSRVFTDVTEELGVVDEQGRGMQAIFWDFDQDGDDDLYVANDVSYNVLYRNEGDGTFRDVTFLVGLDDPRGGMGLTVGDVDRDGDEDLFLTNWQLEANALYQNNLINRAGRKLHTGTFADHTVQSRLGPAGIGVTSWGCELFDADNDGDLDLFVANGYTSPDYESTGICVGQPNHFFLNDGRGRFTEAFEDGGSALSTPLPSRGAVACDYDRDGLLDVLVTANNSRVQLLQNRGPSNGHWALLRFAGSNGNTHAIGARVEARCGEDRFVASLRAGTGYLTGNAPELHLGLGDHEHIDELVIHWPSGRTTTHEGLDVDRVLSIAEPQ